VAEGITIKSLVFDSEIFGFGCGELIVSGPATIRGILDASQEAESQGLVHLTAKVHAAESPNLNVLLSAGFRLMMTSLDMEAKVCLPGTSGQVDLALPTDRDRILEISRLSFTKETRFHADPTFDPTAISKLHVRWTENLLDDPEVIVLIRRVNKTVHGFITLARTEEMAHIGLFAVDPKIRRCGHGRALLDAAMIHCFQEVKSLTVRTECINYSALNAYIDSGFRVTGAMHALHRMAAPKAKS